MEGDSSGVLIGVATGDSRQNVFLGMEAHTEKCVWRGGEIIGGSEAGCSTRIVLVSWKWGKRAMRDHSRMSTRDQVMTEAVNLEELRKW